MTNRRLVPMPTKPTGPGPAPLAAMKTWHAFAFLISTAIVMYYAKWPILFIAGMIGFFWGWPG